jgi:hypothetical protein
MVSSPAPASANFVMSMWRLGLWLRWKRLNRIANSEPLMMMPPCNTHQSTLFKTHFKQVREDQGSFLHCHLGGRQYRRGSLTLIGWRATHLLWHGIASLAPKAKRDQAPVYRDDFEEFAIVLEVRSLESPADRIYDCPLCEALIAVQGDIW